ncbi:MAG: hypothetical protein QXR73_02900, partial [Candidatus Micrarchaeaceae archaeon]
QQMINITESNYSNYLTYNGNTANFEIFNAIGAIQPSWIEKNLSGKLVTWINIANGIAANSIAPLYIGFASNTLNMLSNSGTVGIGEIPTATSTYGQYDDGASVFNNYFAGGSLTGWTTAGASGQTTSAPSGNPTFGTQAFYANGANGDYLYTAASGQSSNMIIEYYTYTTNLDDLYFLASSSGAGQMMRVGDGSGWYGITSTSSWTSWTAPPDTGTWEDEWLTVGVKVVGGSAIGYLSVGVNLYGSELGSNPTNVYTVANDGNYLGLIGDAASSTTTQYWSGIIVRAYPPNGVMPSVGFGAVQPTQLKSSFTENGLPSATTWNVTYDSILNSSTTNTITFMTASGSHAYAVANQIASNILYFPMPSSGSAVAGNTTAITFATKSAALTFDDSPTTGNIIFNGVTYADGASNTVLAGVYAINAIAPSSYNFYDWTASNNATFANTLAANTMVTIYGNSIITANYQPSAVCTISLPTTMINFGSLNPLNNIPTTNAITDDDTGTVGANILVFGGNWILSANALIGFGVSNTTWSSANGISFATANRLTATPAVTGLTVPTSGSNIIYFGVGIPGGAPSGGYSQTITIENSC